MILSKEQYNKLPKHLQGYFIKGNIHVAVKPLALMSYLVTLGSREKDVVLDPFIGSGTTAIACKLLRRSCIGIEVEPDYCKISQERLNRFSTPVYLKDVYA